MISWGACSGPIIHVFHYMSLQIIIFFFLKKKNENRGRERENTEEGRKKKGREIRKEGNNFEFGKSSELVRLTSLINLLLRH